MEAQKKFLTLHIRVAILVLLLGMVLKALQYSLMGTIGILLGFLGISLLYFLRFQKKEVKGSIAYIKLVLVLFWCLNGIFVVLHLPFGEIFKIISMVAFVFWCAMEGTHYFKADNENGKKISKHFILWNALMIVGALAIVVGGLFAFLSWEYALHLLVIGCALVLMYILRDVFIAPQEAMD